MLRNGAKKTRVFKEFTLKALTPPPLSQLSEQKKKEPNSPFFIESS